MSERVSEREKERERDRDRDREKARERERGSERVEMREEREREREMLFLSPSRVCIAAIMLSHAASCKLGCGWIKAGQSTN